MRISTAQYYSSSVMDFQKLNSQLNQTQEKISSNSRLIHYSDNPIDGLKISQLEQQVSNIDQYKKNIQEAINQNDQAISVLESVSSLLSSAKELGGQASYPLISDVSKAQISQGLSSLLDQLQDLFNAKNDQGDYLFSGLKADEAPFVKIDDLYSYVGFQNQKYIQVSNDTSLPVSDSGYQLFEEINSSLGQKGILLTLSELRGSIESGDQESTSSLLSHLDSAINHVAQASSAIGVRLQKLDSTLEFQGGVKDSIQQRLSEIKDVDISTAAAELSMQSLILQATQASFSKISQLSLFNFL